MARQVSKEELLAECAYLNSDFANLFIEIHGRATGGGVIELDDKSTGKLPVLDCRALSSKQKNELSVLFKKLESETRKVGGAETQEQLEKLQPIFEEINAKVAYILNLDDEFLEEVKLIRTILSERRISRTMIARPDSVKGEEQPKMAPPKKRKRRTGQAAH